MLSSQSHGTKGPLLVLLHWLGGSAYTWTEVAKSLSAQGLHCVALDLPGFGDAADNPHYSVQAMADEVLATIRALRIANPDQPLLLAGHSMGGKVAAVLARAAADSTDGLHDLRALILVSPSPPGIEPMPDSKRKQMMESLGHSTGDAEEDRKHAAKFVDDNTGKLPLEPAIRDRAIHGVLRMSRAALRAWLDSGSKEDWSARVGTLQLPALLFAGTEDAALGPDAQSEHTLPHLANGQLIALDGSGHLSPLERPAELTDHILTFLRTLDLPLQPETANLSPEFEDLLRYDHTSPQTRAVLLERLNDPAPAQSIPSELQPTLRALAAAVVPDAGFDLAARVDATLAEPHGDGWRFDTLPPDLEAWRTGLLSLNAAAKREFNVPFIALHATQQHDLLTQASEGKLGKGALGTLHLGGSANAFTATQMQQWFEDVRGLFARLYTADPRTLQRIGFTGFADEHGFTQIKLGETEDFEA
jgi:pimeloyl-ACP methyl ester carboxylesterase